MNDSPPASGTLHGNRRYAPGSDPASNFMRPPRVLIVDDDLAILRVHAEAVRRLGFEVETASDGVEALALMVLEFDLVVTDADMPSVDGFELVRQIRQQGEYSTTPIVMVTGSASRQVRLSAAEAGVDDFFTKPLDLAEFEMRSRWLLELKFSRDALLKQGAELEGMVADRTRDLRKALRDMTQARRETYEAHTETVRCLSIAVEWKDSATAAHIARIGKSAAILGRELGMGEARVNALRHASAMHDIGKISVPDSILMKPGALTPEERAVMEQHTTNGASILGGTSSELLQLGSTIALTHHERWDGSGYPKGLAHEGIPMEGRICAIVDVYDALCSARPYKMPRPHEEVMQVIRAESGHHFDPRIVEAFVAVESRVGQVRVDHPDPALPDQNTLSNSS